MTQLMQGLLCLWIGLAWSVPKTAQAQFQVSPDSSFYTLQDSFYQYYQDDSTEGGIYNKMRRTGMIWGPRLAPDGKMSRANKAMLNYTRAYKNITTGAATGLPVPIVFPSLYPSPIDWRELGHLTPLAGNLNSSIAKGMGQVQRLVFHPAYTGNTNQIIYAGSHYGGLYRTDNGGQQWYNYHTDRGLSMTSVGDVATSANFVFVCTGNGDHASSAFGAQADYAPIRGNINDFSPLHTQGVYRNTHNNPTSQWISINGAVSNSVTMFDGTFRDDLLVVFAQGGTMRRIMVNPTNEQILFVATSQGIFRTIDGGATWKQVLIGPPNGTGGYALETAWRGLEFHPTNPNIVYASAKDVYKSVDGGLTWTSMTSHQGLQAGTKRTNITVTPAAPDRLYAYAVGTRSYIFLYENGSWQNKANVDNAQKDWVDIAVSPVYQDVVHVTGRRISVSYDFDAAGTANFNALNMVDIHDDIHYLGYPPNKDTVLFAGTHGGVSKATVSSTSTFPWINLYDGLGLALIFSFDDWEGDDSLLMTANQDIGINYSYNRGELWYSKGGGDGYGVRINDQTSNAYIKTNSYDGVFQLYPTLRKQSNQGVAPNSSSVAIHQPP